jgi:copper homeostasis protein CutC
MAGSGVNHTNLARFYNIGITQYHASASKFVSSSMQYDNPMVLFEQFPGMRQQLQIADEQQINAMRNEISKLKTNKIS